MTISNQTAAYYYNGNDATTAFVFGNVLFAESAITVILTSSAGVDTVQVLNTDYTVALAGDFSQATVNMVTPPATGEQLTIVRAQPLTQSQDLIEGGPLPAESTEQTFDRFALQNQTQQVDLDRSLKFSASFEDAATIEVPVPVASQILGWNAAGDALINVDPGDAGVVTPGTDTVSTVTIQDDAVTTAKIADDAVTLAKIQNIDGFTVLGRYDEDNGEAGAITLFGLRTMAGSSGWHLNGLTLSVAADADHDTTVADGYCLDATGVRVMQLASGITKQIDAAWAVGDDQGGLDTGTVDTDTVYAVWLIERSDTGVVDVLYSESFTNPTMPSNYDYKRRIGFVYTDASSNIYPYEQTGTRFVFQNDFVLFESADPGISNNDSPPAGPPYASFYGHARLFEGTAGDPGDDYSLYLWTNMTLSGGVRSREQSIFQIDLDEGTSDVELTDGISTFEVTLGSDAIFVWGATVGGGASNFRVYVRHIEDRLLAMGA